MNIVYYEKESEKLPEYEGIQKGTACRIIKTAKGYDDGGVYALYDRKQRSLY